MRRVDDVRAQRREVREGDRTIIREPGRTIIREGNVTVIRRDESERFRYGARNMIAERRGGELRTIAVRPDGTRIINVTDDSGRLIRRSRRDQFGREYVMFENSRPRMGTGTAIGIGVAAGLAAGLGVAYLANVPPPVVTLPPEQYIVDTRYAPPAMLYDTLAAPPVDVIERPYTLDEIRYTPALRQRMRSVDINTITFDSGSFELRQDQYGQLEAIANAIRQVTDANANEVFLIEGHTDASRHRGGQPVALGPPRRSGGGRADRAVPDPAREPDHAGLRRTAAQGAGPGAGASGTAASRCAASRRCWPESSRAITTKAGPSRGGPAFYSCSLIPALRITSLQRLLSAST